MEFIFINLKNTIAENQIMTEITIIRVTDKIKFKLPKVEERIKLKKITEWSACQQSLLRVQGCQDRQHHGEQNQVLQAFLQRRHEYDTRILRQGGKVGEE